MKLKIPGTEKIRQESPWLCSIKTIAFNVQFVSKNEIFCQQASIKKAPGSLRALFGIQRLCLTVLCEVLNSTNHLARVAVLVVIP